MKSISPESMPAYHEMCKRWEQHTIGTLPKGPTRAEIDMTYRIYSLVCAHAFSISRLLRIREEINLEKKRKIPCRKTVRALLAEEFAETEALAQSYDALLAFCDGDEAQLWRQMRRRRALESSINAYILGEDGTQ